MIIVLAEYRYIGTVSQVSVQNGLDTETTWLEQHIVVELAQSDLKGTQNL